MTSVARRRRESSESGINGLMRFIKLHYEFMGIARHQRSLQENWTRLESDGNTAIKNDNSIINHASATPSTPGRLVPCVGETATVKGFAAIETFCSKSHNSAH